MKGLRVHFSGLKAAVNEELSLVAAQLGMRVCSRVPVVGCGTLDVLVAGARVGPTAEATAKVLNATVMTPADFLAAATIELPPAPAVLVSPADESPPPTTARDPLPRPKSRRLTDDAPRQASRAQRPAGVVTTWTPGVLAVETSFSSRRATSFDAASAQKLILKQATAHVHEFLKERTGGADDLVIMQAAWMDEEQRATTRRFADVLGFDTTFNTNKAHMQLGAIVCVSGDLRPYDACVVLLSGETKMGTRFAHRSVQFLTFDRERGISFVGHVRVLNSDGSWVIVKAHSELAQEQYPWSYGGADSTPVAGKCTVHLVLINMRTDCAGCWADWYVGYRGIRKHLMRLRGVELQATWTLEWAFLRDFVELAERAGLFAASSAAKMREFLSALFGDRHLWSLTWMPARSGGLDQFSNNFVECVFAAWKKAGDLTYALGLADLFCKGREKKDLQWERMRRAMLMEDLKQCNRCRASNASPAEKLLFLRYHWRVAGKFMWHVNMASKYTPVWLADDRIELVPSPTGPASDGNNDDGDSSDDTEADAIDVHDAQMNAHSGEAAAADTGARGGASVETGASTRGSDDNDDDDDGSDDAEVKAIGVHDLPTNGGVGAAAAPDGGGRGGSAPGRSRGGAPDTSASGGGAAAEPDTGAGGAASAPARGGAAPRPGAAAGAGGAPGTRHDRGAAAVADAGPTPSRKRARGKSAPSAKKGPTFRDAARRLQAQITSTEYVRGEALNGLRFNSNNSAAASFDRLWDFYYPPKLRWTTQVRVVGGVIRCAARVLDTGETTPCRWCTEMGGPCWRVICANGGTLAVSDISVRHLRAFALGRLDDLVLPRSRSMMTPATKLRVQMPASFHPQQFPAHPRHANIPALLARGVAVPVDVEEATVMDTDSADHGDNSAPDDTGAEIISREAMQELVRATNTGPLPKMRGPMAAVVEQYYSQLQQVVAKFKAAVSVTLRPEAVQRFHELEAVSSNLASQLESDVMLMERCVVAVARACPTAAAIVGEPVELSRASLVAHFRDLISECIRTDEDSVLEDCLNALQRAANTEDFPNDPRGRQFGSANVRM